MENKEYHWSKYPMGEAEAEAEELQQRVKSGEALSYGEAEKLVIIDRLKKGFISFESSRRDYVEEVPEELMRSPEVQLAAREGVIVLLQKYAAISSAIRVKERFNLPEEFIQSPEYQQAAKEAMLARIGNGNIAEAVGGASMLNLPKEMVLAIAKEGIIERLTYGYHYDAFIIKRDFEVPEEIIQSPEVQSAAKERRITLLERGRFDEAREVKEKFNLSE